MSICISLKKTNEKIDHFSAKDLLNLQTTHNNICSSYYIPQATPSYHNLEQHLILTMKLIFQMAVAQLHTRYGMKELNTINKATFLFTQKLMNRMIVWVIHSLPFE